MKTGNFFTETAFFLFFLGTGFSGGPRLTIPEDQVRPVSR
jgi:hypothetical protein